MKDSALKRILLVLYFNYKELLSGLGLAFFRPKPLLASMDYNKYWENRPPMTLQPRYVIMKDQINHGESVLDVGCGDGYLLTYLKKAKGIKELGIDISSVAVKRAVSLGVNARLDLLLDLAKEKEGVLFDHVIMSEVVEHLANAEDYVLAAFKLSRKTVMISYPNIAYWPYRLRLLFGRFPIQSDCVSHPAEHLRFWSLADFKDWINNLKLADAHEVSFYPSNGITIFNLHKILPNIFCHQVVVVVRKVQKECA